MVEKVLIVKAQTKNGLQFLISKFEFDSLKQRLADEPETEVAVLKLDNDTCRIKIGEIDFENFGTH